MLRPDALESCKYAGLTQREVAEELGVSTGAAVSLQIKRLKKITKEDKACAKKTKKIEARLVNTNGHY